MFRMDTDKLVRSYLPVKAANPAEIDAGHICACAGVLFTNLAPWILAADDLDARASFFASLLVSVEKQIDGKLDG
jgi:hypothetical protein